jgi:L-lactate dehydrogenase
MIFFGNYSDKNKRDRRLKMKISFIGSGKVGVAVAYTTALKGLAQEIVLTDVSSDKAHGEALDILQGQAFCPQANIKHGEIEDTANSDIVVITAGIPRKADEPRVMLLSRNAGLIADITKKVVALSPHCIILMITNPLDVMTHLAYQASGLPAGRVIGMGTVLDTARYRSYLAQHFQVDARDLDAYVVGEHGETMVPLVTNISIKGVPLVNLPNYDAPAVTRIANEVRAASGQVIALKGGTVFAPAVAACAILEAIVHDNRQILPVSTFNSNYGTAVSLPTVIGRQGAGSTLVIPMSQAEEAALEHSIANIKKYLNEINC